VAGTTAGVADGTGPLLLHTTPLAATVAGTTTKAAVGSKLAAIGATVGGVLGVALGGAAVVGAGYLGYRLVKALVSSPEPTEPEPS
jgi:hypothetical protein